MWKYKAERSEEWGNGKIINFFKCSTVSGSAAGLGWRELHDGNPTDSNGIKNCVD